MWMNDGYGLWLRVASVNKTREHLALKPSRSMKSSRTETTRASLRRGRTRGDAESPPRTRSSPARSPARNRRFSPAAPASAVPPRSPGRRSPARKSPARKSASKFPARKSPSRATDVKELPSRRPALKEEVPPSEPKPKPIEIVTRISRTRRSEYSIKDLSVGLTQVEMAVGEHLNGLESQRERLPRNVALKEEVITRGSARLRKSSSRTSESASRSLTLPLGEDSNESEDELPREKSVSSVRKLATPLRGFSLSKATTSGNRWEFGGRVGSAMLIVVLPAWVFALLSQCAHSCSFRMPEMETFTSSALFSWNATALGLAQISLQGILACLPILGRRSERMDDSGKSQYFNGLFASLLTVFAIFAVNFFKILSVNAILEEYLRLAVMFYILAAALAVILFLRSRKLNDDQLNPYGNTGYVLYDFWMGRELFPRYRNLDFKLLLHRICNINGLILTVLLFASGLTLPEPRAVDINNYQDTLKHLKYDPTLLVFSSMQLVYFLNLIANEHKITSTFSWHSEGVGYMQAVCSALYPFYFVTISKFVRDHKVSLSSNILIATSVVYFIGFLIYLFSNNIKHEFRRNPLQAKFHNLEVMPTFLGKRLLVSGPWSVVRHPNYVGDMILHLALAVPGALAGPALAVLPSLTVVPILAHRAARDGARCRRRYGAAWQRYAMRVPSALIPKIF